SHPAEHAAEGEGGPAEVRRGRELGEHDDDGAPAAALGQLVGVAAHVELPPEEVLGDGVGGADRGPAVEHEDGPGHERTVDAVGVGAAQRDRLREPELLGQGAAPAAGDEVEVLVAHQASRIIAVAWPPAAHTEMRPRAGLPVSAFLSARSLASVPTIRPPVAPNGWPAAREEPVTLSRSGATEPSGSRSR